MGRATIAVLVSLMLVTSVSELQAQSISLDAIGPTISALGSGFLPDEIFIAAPGAPLVLPPPTPTIAAFGAEMNALSYGRTLPEFSTLTPALFSVSIGGMGAAGTAVAVESTAAEESDDDDEEEDSEEEQDDDGEEDEDEVGSSSPGTDIVAFSLKPGSPYIGAPDPVSGLSISPGDILVDGTTAALLLGSVMSEPAILHTAESLGLLTIRSGAVSDTNLNALDMAVPEPSSCIALLFVMMAMLFRRDVVVS